MDFSARTVRVALVAVVLLGFWSAVGFNDTPETSPDPEPQPHQTTPLRSSEQTSTGALKTFTGAEFKQLFDELALPNTRPIISPPAITGNEQADDRIVELAEARGYQLRSEAAGSLSSIDGIELQELLIGDWQALQQAATNDGIQIAIRSGYRSVTDQAELFRAELAKIGLTPALINSGDFDASIQEILRFVAPPGYSRHHPGYTIDVFDQSASVFEFSAAFQWLKADNYANAKKFGFIPSYPEGVSNQGPDPEVWEYVWANRDFVVE